MGRKRSFAVILNERQILQVCAQKRTVGFRPDVVVQLVFSAGQFRPTENDDGTLVI